MLLSMDVMKVRDWTYLEDPPQDIGPARHLLEVYSKIPYNDLDGHIRRVVSSFIHVLLFLAQQLTLYPAREGLVRLTVPLRWTMEIPIHPRPQGSSLSTGPFPPQRRRL
jgi:hypothetical protein